jgi:Dna[CI] antecedent, DciA
VGCYAKLVRSSGKHRRRLHVPESIDVTIEHARGPDAPWAKPAIRERVWREAVGGRIAERARPEELTRGTLWVRVATSVWASELSLLSAELIQRLRVRGVTVQNLRFRVAPIDPHGGRPDPRRTQVVPPLAPLPPELLGHLAVVGDEELRQGIAHAARANLAWQENLAPEPRPAPRRPPRP